MKNKMKFLGIMALAVVIGFSACNNGSTGGGGKSSGGAASSGGSGTKTGGGSGTKKPAGGGGGSGSSWISVADTKFRDSFRDNKFDGVIFMSSIECIAWGNNKFVAYGNESSGVSERKIVYSSDGINWTAVTDSTLGTYAIHAIAWGNDKFVAVGSGDGFKIAYSYDGINWTIVTDSTFGTYDKINQIAWGNNKFVAVGTGCKMAYSSDGITWTEVTDNKLGTTLLGSNSLSRTKGDITCIAWGNNKFVVASFYTEIALISGQTTPCTEIAYSPDGITWTRVAGIFGGRISDIAWGNNKFVVVGGRDIFYSSDAITWSGVPPSLSYPKNISFYSIAWGNNKFVAVGADGKIANSSDGINWTEVTDSTFGSDTIWGVAWGNNKFVAVGNSGRMAYSLTGD
jgi:hypothetical protein